MEQIAVIKENGGRIGQNSEETGARRNDVAIAKGKQREKSEQQKY